MQKTNDFSLLFSVKGEWVMLSKAFKVKRLTQERMVRIFWIPWLIRSLTIWITWIGMNF